MTNFKRTFFVILTVTIVLQTFRHCYMMFVAETASIVDKYDDAEKLIDKTKTLDELETLYKAELEKEDSSDQYKYYTAIREVEEISNSIRELWFYWCIGLLSIILGVVIHEKWEKWLGSTLVLAGFFEMAFWTSPLSSFLMGNLGFDELLTSKLILSAISTALIILIWLTEERRLKST